MVTGRWEVLSDRGTAAELHRRAADRAAPGPSGERRLVVMDVLRPAVVLGSGQPESDVDAPRAIAAGLDVARRRSGGGAVLVGPGQVLWVDLVLPAGDPQWSDDVGRAAWWVGEAWLAALDSIGIPGAEVWRGPMRRTPWSGRVCFAGRGPGEVHVAGQKLVGISQRRTRTAALFQCAALLRWEPDELLQVLHLAPEARARGAEELAGVAAGIGDRADVEALEAAFVGQVTSGHGSPSRQVGRP